MKALPLALLVVMTAATGCFVTKVVSVPMRVTGAVVSIVPSVGNTAHDAIDQAADSVDDLPF